jgi:hypothetical protein
VAKIARRNLHHRPASQGFGELRFFELVFVANVEAVVEPDAAGEYTLDNPELKERASRREIAGSTRFGLLQPDSVCWRPSAAGLAKMRS